MTATAERRMGPDRLFDLRFVLDGRISPDGMSVVYEVAAVDRENMRDSVGLRLLSTVDGEDIELTSGGFDLQARWSPDGKRLAFRSMRDGKPPQLYVMPATGGEAEVLTDFVRGAGSAPAWSPDGRELAFSASPATEPFDPGAPYRVTRAFWRFDNLGRLDVMAEDVWTVDADGGPPVHVFEEGGRVMHLAWSPSGDALVWSSFCRRDSELCAVRVWDKATGEVRTIIEVPLTGDAPSVAWTADGTRIVYIESPALPNRTAVWVVDRNGGEPERRDPPSSSSILGRLQPDFPANMLAARVLTCEDDYAYAFVQVGGELRIQRFSLSGPLECTTVVGGERTCSPLHLVGDRLLFAATTFEETPELFLCNRDGSDEQRLTATNREVLDTFPVPRVEHLRFPSVDGQEVEGWLLLPPTGEAPFPAVVHAHGGPHAGFGYLFSYDNRMLVDAGYAVLLVNHRGSTGYGEEFAEAILCDWGNLDFKDLMAALDLVIDRGLVDGDRLGMYGASGGGYLTGWAVGQTDRFKAAVSEVPLLDFQSWMGTTDIGPMVWEVWMGGPAGSPEAQENYRRCSPITYAHRCTTPTLLVQHDADLRAPVGQAEQFFTTLKSNGCVAEMLRLPGTAHGGMLNIGRPTCRLAQNEALLDWMDRYVLGAGTG